jgi:hypothetical protein
MDGYVGSAPACYGRSLGSNPDISLKIRNKWATSAKEWPTHSSPPKKIQKKGLAGAVLRIRDVYPGSRILNFTHPRSLIPNPKTATKERGIKKFVVIPFL